MDLVLQNLDTISLVDKLSPVFASEMCEDGRISILTDNNAFVYTLMNYMSNEFGDMAFKKNVIKLPKSSLKQEFGNDFVECFNNIDENDLHKMLRDLDLSNSTENSIVADVKPVSLKWSPKGLQGKSSCALAILNNHHGLSIMVEYRDVTDVANYCCVSNVTKYIVQEASKEWKNETLMNPDEWKKHTMATRPTAFVWSHLIESVNEAYAVLFVAHPNGTVTSWKFTRIGENTLESNPLQFVGRFSSALKNISSMFWRGHGVNVGALCLGNHDGKLSITRVSNLNMERLIYEEDHIFGGTENKKKVNHITSIEYNQYSFIISALEAFLHIILVLEDGSILDEIYYNTGNMATTGLCHYKENILLLLTGEKLRKLTLNVEDNQVLMKDEIISVNFDHSTFRGCGLILSKNRMFLGILAYPCRLKDIAKHPTPSKFFIYYDTTKSPLKMILENTERNLVEYLDCFEVLRMLCFKEKKFPWQGMEKLDYDKLKLQQLKSLRWIAKLSENVYNIVPRIDGYHIKPYILLHHLVTIQLVVKRMRKLLNDFCQGKQLSNFQMRSLDVCNMYLKEMVMMKTLEKCKVGERFVDDMIGVMEIANEIEYPDMPHCFWCEEKIIGLSCLRSHKDSRCCISMMQIYLTPGFKCPFCKCVAHIEIAKEYDIVTCPYCDVPMNGRYSLENVQIALEETDELTRKKMELSLLKDIPDDIHLNSDFCGGEGDLFENIENTVEYLALSDSDEEEIVGERMRTLYKEFFDPRKASLNRNESLGNLDESYLIADDQSKDNDSYEEDLVENDISEDQKALIYNSSVSKGNCSIDGEDNMELDET